MEVPPEMTACVEGKFGSNGAPITCCPREPGKSTREEALPFMAKRGVSGEHDLERAQKDCTMRMRAGL